MCKPGALLSFALSVTGNVLSQTEIKQVALSAKGDWLAVFKWSNNITEGEWFNHPAGPARIQVGQYF